jgi:hypothetical protein
MLSSDWDEHDFHWGYGMFARKRLSRAQGGTNRRIKFLCAKYFALKRTQAFYDTVDQVNLEPAK